MGIHNINTPRLDGYLGPYTRDQIIYSDHEAELFSATAIVGVKVDNSGIADGRVLTYNFSTNTLVYSSAGGAGIIITESQVTNLVSDLASKAPLASPTFTGTVIAPTPTLTDNSTLVSTTAFVKGQGYLTTNAVASVAGRTGVVTLVEGDIANLTGDLAAKATDTSVVHNTGTETIAGAKTFSTIISGSISGNSATTTNGVVTTGSYADPTWLTSLASSKLTGTVATARLGTGTANSSSFLRGDQTWAATVTTPGGSTTQLQYNNAGSLGGLASTSVSTAGSLITVQAQAIDDKPLVLKGASSQTGNLQEWQTNGGTALSIVDSAGNISIVPFTFAGTGVPATGTDMCPWLYVSYGSKTIRCALSCKTAPSGGSFVVVVKRSSDAGSTFPDTIATITLTTGNKLVTTTTFTNSVLSAADILRLDITSVNAAADWTLRLSTISKNQ